MLVLDLSFPLRNVLINPGERGGGGIKLLPDEVHAVPNLMTLAWKHYKFWPQPISIVDWGLRACSVSKGRACTECWWVTAYMHVQNIPLDVLISVLPNGNTMALDAFCTTLPGPYDVTRTIQVVRSITAHLWGIADYNIMLTLRHLLKYVHNRTFKFGGR